MSLLEQLKRLKYGKEVHLTMMDSGLEVHMVGPSGYSQGVIDSHDLEEDAVGHLEAALLQMNDRLDDWMATLIDEEDRIKEESLNAGS